MITRLEVYSEICKDIERPRRRWNYQVLNHDGDVLVFDRVLSTTIAGAKLACAWVTARWNVEPIVME